MVQVGPTRYLVPEREARALAAFLATSSWEGRMEVNREISEHSEVLNSAWKGFVQAFRKPRELLANTVGISLR